MMFFDMVYFLKSTNIIIVFNIASQQVSSHPHIEDCPQSRRKSKFTWVETRKDMTNFFYFLYIKWYTTRQSGF